MQIYLKDKFDIDTTLPKSGTIYILAESREKFTSVIKKYVLKEMYYKLHLSVLDKSDKLLETPEEDNQQPITNLND